MEEMNTKLIFFLGIILAATGIISPPVALICGIVFGFSFPHPYPSGEPDALALSSAGVRWSASASA